MIISDHQTAMQRHIKTQIRAVPFPLKGLQPHEGSSETLMLSVISSDAPMLIMVNFTQ